MKTICIKGLCLGGNKGGAAILTSLLSLLREDIPDFKTRMISNNIEEDITWQKYYDVELVPLPQTKEISKHVSLYKNADLVIDMHGVKFLGPMGLTSTFSSMYPIVIPRMLGIPSVAFTQTYGPFRNNITKNAARFTLKFANLIYSRDIESNNLLDTIGYSGKYKTYPDVAFAMPKADLTELTCSNEVLDFIGRGDFIGVSVSSQVISEEKKRGMSQQYQSRIVNLLESLLNQGYRVLFIPHCNKQNSVDQDDLILSLKIQALFPNFNNQLLVVKDDLPPQQLKTLISKSSIFIGSRYHALIAALSSGIPSVSIGWNHKYDGLFDLFGLRQYSLWAHECTDHDLLRISKELLENREEISSKLLKLLPAIIDDVKTSVRDVSLLLR